MTNPTIQQPFSNVQLELLNLYSRNISDEELQLIRDMLARFFADRASQAANKVWDEKGLDAQELLKKHRHTSCPPKIAAQEILEDLEKTNLTNDPEWQAARSLAWEQEKHNYLIV